MDDITDNQTIDSKLNKLYYDIGNVVGCEITNAKNELKSYINILLIVLLFNTILVVGMMIMFMNMNTQHGVNTNVVNISKQRDSHLNEKENSLNSSNYY